jgi:hypothetical protein
MGASKASTQLLHTPLIPTRVSGVIWGWVEVAGVVLGGDNVTEDKPSTRTGQNQRHDVGRLRMSTQYARV